MKGSQFKTEVPNLWFNLHKVRSTLHRYWFICKDTLKMIEELLGLARSKVRISILIGPDKRSFLIFDGRTIGGFGV